MVNATTAPVNGARGLHELVWNVSGSFCQLQLIEPMQHQGFAQRVPSQAVAGASALANQLSARWNGGSAPPVVPGTLLGSLLHGFDSDSTFPGVQGLVIQAACSPDMWAVAATSSVPACSGWFTGPCAEAVLDVQSGRAAKTWCPVLATLMALALFERFRGCTPLRAV